MTSKSKKPRKPSWASEILTTKQTLFVREYLIDLNATQAAIRAGYSSRTAEAQGSKVLNERKVAAAIAAAMQERAERTELTADMVIAELRKIAFANMQDFVSISTDGKEKGQATVDLSKLSRDQFAAIGEIRIEDIDSGRRTGKRTVFKLLDKRAALVDLGKHLGIFIERKQVEHTGTIEIQNAAREVDSLLLEAASSVATGANTRRIH